MRKSAIWAIGALAVASTLMTGPALALGAAAPACSLPVGDMQRAQGLRQANGLDQTEAHVSALHCGASVKSDFSPIEMSPDEASEMTRRQNLVSTLGKVNKILDDAAPSRYVGSWLDSPGGGSLVLDYVSADAGDEARVAALLPPGTPFRLGTGLVSLHRQDALRAALVRSFNQLDAAGALILSQTTDDKTGLTTLLLDEAAPASAEAKITQLVGADGLVVKRVNKATSKSGPEDLRTDPQPRQYGGAYASNVTTSTTCTASPTATSAASYYTIIAGHCGHPNDAWVMGYPGSRTLGTGAGNTLYPVPSSGVTDCDCQGIRVPSTLASSYTLVNGNATYPFSSQAGEGGNTVGQAVCVSGASEYAQYGSDKCGNVQGTHGGYSVTPLGQSVHVYDLIYVVFPSSECDTPSCTTQGDSGGTWGAGHEYQGPHAGKVTASNGLVFPAFSRAQRLYNNLQIAVHDLGH